MVEDKPLELGRAIEAKAKTGQSTLFKADNASVLWSYDESGRREVTTDVVEWRRSEGWGEFIDVARALQGRTPAEKLARRQGCDARAPCVGDPRLLGRSCDERMPR